MQDNLFLVHEKTEALLVTDRRTFKYPRIVLGEHEIKWKKSINLPGASAFGPWLL